MRPSIVVVDERAAGPHDPFGEAINRALDAGCRARLRPAYTGPLMTIIAAPPGFRLVCADMGKTDLGTDPKAVSEIVLAFAFPEAGTFPVPITPTGAPNLEKPWLLVHPNGCYSMGRDRYSDFGEWQKEMGLEA